MAIGLFSFSPGDPRRLVFGVLLLLLVDAIWVGSSELTKYIYQNAGFDKPYFSTYAKTSMFILYLGGFLFWRPWREQCCSHVRKTDSTNAHNGTVVVDADNNETSSEQDPDQLDDGPDSKLSEPLYVPIKLSDSERSSVASDLDKLESVETSPALLKKKGKVRFSNLLEVRHMSDTEAEAANLARMSYTASLRLEETHSRNANKLHPKQVAKIALLFCIPWFLGNLSYQEALDETQAAVVNILSSTSGLFTLILAALFPSSYGDKFTASKLVAVLISIAGIVLVSMSHASQQDQLQLGALWALCGAALYAVYLVMLKKKVDNEERLDIPMFFGFVGMFNMVLLWPGLLVLHHLKLESFVWPTPQQWMYLALNGLIGTVLSEFLWLWGCFLTSSLIATLSLSLTIPLTVIVDIFLKKVSFNWMFFMGIPPVFISFFAVTLLSHWKDWDPVMLVVKKLVHCFCHCRRRTHARTPEDLEQRESLIGIEDGGGGQEEMEGCS
ncbi:solute carrier family 35 member F5-like [Branchiostoma lanceolatum]|uniref:solute carrier family 35 member F5-like n=1 Tax=Branchiostoma lanceolatum TaxID=7740 RepID=UPI00345171E9